MKKMILSVLFWCIFGYAVDFSGNWKISEGKGLNGNAYRGRVSIAAENDCFKVNWALENSNPANFSGVGIPDGNNLYVGWGLSNIGYGVCVYKITQNGTLEGEWAANGTKGMRGTEKATGGKAGQLEGTYQISGNNPMGQATYKGTLTIIKMGNHYALSWAVANASYNGVGMVVDNKLVVGWGFSDKYGLVHYQFSGNTAKGVWLTGDSEKSGIENLVK